MKNALIIGPGYVGREIIDLLKSEGNYVITTLVRREAAAEEFSKEGINAIRGDLNETEKIRNLAKENDVIFHTATADHVKSAQAILDGIKDRAADGKHSIYLHQSGASVLSDSSAGNISGEEIFSDLVPGDIDKVADTAPHRNVDLAILKARKEIGDMAKIFIFMPPIIYGTNPKYNRLSIQIPKLTRFALEKGYVGVVGKGKGVWGAVHVLDLAKAYIIVLHWLEENPPSKEISNPYFFCESEEVAWSDVSRIIGKGVHAAGRINSPEPRTVPEDQWRDLYGKHTPDGLACNARGRADRLKALGWKPVQRTVQEAYVKEDLPVLLKE